jgi:uncharacterized membrane protein
LWQRSTGWQALSGDAVLESVAISVSKNFQFIAGYGHNQGEVDHIWVRTIDGSQSLLTWPDDLSAGVIPFAVSNDGKTAVGNALRFPTPEWPERIAVRWRADGQSSYLQNPAGEELSVASACDADCNIIFGAGLYNYYDPSHPHPGEAWYLKNDGSFGYLGALADALLSPRSYAAVDATSDGSLVVGTYTTNEFPSVANGMFIWTQATGIASLHSLVAELGVGDDDWHIFDSMRLSADGKKILLGGAYQSHSSQVQQNRIVVLSLIPKTSTN